MLHQEDILWIIITVLAILALIYVNLLTAILVYIIGVMAILLLRVKNNTDKKNKTESNEQKCIKHSFISAYV
jgi:Flp pilus assembly protein TadB